ncbi:phosphatidylglycerophosphatase A [Campylobacter blaseri]|uniref:Phosphatidylglycerophosphatase A n=1 Tax=Campylobacter blaseri TaxID=2042961 RepID=A0A2P8QZ25_9BACT|nr:phosphatidylglycerophosphatase A [Campylobacter blaseri]PSM51487.1 phosphatidylglycerophosphatase A [Campylobacter blaseri]PSM52936.1 phosphatidylglycerophosphatase A [Campylobacter blaseri]QKF86505.1 phosphatidylglycerophosphatase A [Campylobacter blaseri]
MNFEKFFLTFFGLGLIKPAPGTWGTIGGLLVALLIIKFLTIETLFLCSILLFLVSINIINNYEKKIGSHDNSEIVIDEVVGIWIALSISSGSWLAIILSFIYFRAFDIYKPSVIGRADRDVKGGLGVLLDDILAGAFGGLLSLMTIGALMKFGLENFIF